MTAMHMLQNVNDIIYRILEDGKIDDDEKQDFAKVIKVLKKMSYSVDSLELWAKKNGLAE